MSIRIPAVAFVLLAGACSIENDPFEPTIDAGPGHIFVAPSPVYLSEGNSTELQVRIEAPPSLPTTVQCASGDESRLSLGPTQLMFTEANLPDAQIVTLTALEDADAMGEQLMVICASANFDNGLTSVAIADNDFLTIVPTPNGSPPVVVAELQSTNVAVKLSAQPPTTINVNVAHAGTKILTSPGVLTFTPENYNSPQNVTVNGVHDADTTTDPDTLTLSATGLQIITVPFSVTDID
jgi:hypothetical protein